MKRFNKLLYVVLTYVFLASCSYIENGTVIDKRNEEPNKRLMITIIPMKVGNASIPQQYLVNDIEDWAVTTEGKKYGKIIHRDVYISNDSSSLHVLFVSYK